ncbi:MAG: hypothetical protein R2706_11825 [Acidimicrobiales bacterium]
MRQTVFAPAKLTRSLRMTGLRDDGFHLIDAEMVTLDLHDTLVIDPASTGLTIVGGATDVPTGPTNLVARALALAGRTASVELTKRVPSQAGLGVGHLTPAPSLGRIRRPRCRCWSRRRCGLLLGWRSGACHRHW